MLGRCARLGQVEWLARSRQFGSHPVSRADSKLPRSLTADTVPPMRLCKPWATTQRGFLDMSGSSDEQSERDLFEIKGALDVLFTLREEFAQWLEEAQDEARKEELENVYQHVVAMEAEYQRRRGLLEKNIKAG